MTVQFNNLFQVSCKSSDRQHPLLQPLPPPGSPLPVHHRPWGGHGAHTETSIPDCLPLHRLYLHPLHSPHR